MRKKSPNPKKRKAGMQVIINNMMTTVNKTTLKQMRMLQNSVNLCIPKLSFSRLVHEIFQEYNQNLRIQYLALEALQEATEWYLVNLFTDANRCCAHAGRVTLKVKDMHLVLDLRRPQ